MLAHDTARDHFSGPSWQELAMDWVLAGPDQRPSAAVSASLSAANASELNALLECLNEQLPQAPDGQPLAADSVARLRWLLQLTAGRVLQMHVAPGPDHQAQPVGIVEPAQLGELAGSLVAFSPAATAHCLQILAIQRDPESLAVLAEFLSQGTLEDEQSVLVALTPLFQWPPQGLENFFARLGPNVWNWQLLGAMLDLAGHALRKGVMAQHPFQGQADRLCQLLTSTIARLSRLEANPQQFGDNVATIQRVLSNAVALTVSLCDTLGLIGDTAAVPVLREALQLSHRRIQTEAAGGLARLGQPEGRTRLLELAEDPAARLRALAYLDELNIDDQRLEDWRQPVALAEAEAVCWLADPQRFGVPPESLELVDERTLYWPSYESPQACFLYRFTYQFSQGTLSNLIMAGPVVHAFQADLRTLPIDDVYAIFAGWQAVHEDIYEVPRPQFNSAQLQEAERLLGAADTGRFDELQTLALAFFFGQRAVLASGRIDDRAVAIITDGLEELVMASDDRPTSLTPDLVLALYRGRKLLRSFNS